MRKDIKKSSYYVWFLGAQEAKGLRGAEYIVPVVKSLVARERDIEPFKVTLQVSHKGLKIVQNVPKGGLVGGPGPGPGVKAGGKPEVVKHFIPHHAVTCALQDEDIVACILLLFNPVTRCPVHVHAYRCDSVETAEILRGQLHTLIERPDNQKKLAEIEARLRAKGLLMTAPTPSPHAANPGPQTRGPPAARRALSAGGSDGRSTSTRESESSGGSSGGQERIASLYDSLAAELRAKLGAGGRAPLLLPPRDYDTLHRARGNMAAVDLRSSGPSSGIGSDHAPSPDRQSDPRFLDNPSSSDEEWNEQPSEDSLFLVQNSGWDLSLPRARSRHAPTSRQPPPAPDSPPRRRQRSPSPAGPLSPRDRFKDAKEKFLLLEREEQTRRRETDPASPTTPQSRGNPRASSWSRSRESDDEDADDSHPLQRPSGGYYSAQPTGGTDFDDEDDDVFDKVAPYPGGRSRQNMLRRDSHNSNRQSSRENLGGGHLQAEVDSRRVRGPPGYDRRPQYREAPVQREGGEDRGRHRYRGGEDDERVLSPLRQPRPAPRMQVLPTQPLDDDLGYPASSEDLRYRRSKHASPSERSYDDRHSDIPLERYRGPQPAPRHRVTNGNDVGAGERSNGNVNERRGHRGAYNGNYGGSGGELSAAEKKRRSMFDVLEEERRRNSNELAREFKRRSYQELADHERFPGLDRETARLQHHNAANGRRPPQPTGGYRHSYAEGPMHHEALHRTNSSVSSGRVGIAAVHPY